MNISVDLAIKRIKIYAFAVAGLNKRQLALKAGLEAGAVRHIHDEDWNPKLSTIRALEAIIPPGWSFEETPKILTQPKENTHAEG